MLIDFCAFVHTMSTSKPSSDANVSTPTSRANPASDVEEQRMRELISKLNREYYSAVCAEVVPELVKIYATLNVHPKTTK